MKKIALILTTILAIGLDSCQTAWTSEVEIGVYSERINLNQAADEFVMTVFSNQDWTASVTEGMEWISITETGGHELGYLHVSSGNNFDDNARAGSILLKAASGKSITVHLVQSGNIERAADVPDSLL